MDALTCNGLGNRGGRVILRHIARIEPRHHDIGNAGDLERRDMSRIDHRALLQDEFALSNGVHGSCADRIFRRDGSEFHAAFSGTCRRRAVISAMMETAISGGDTAPISSPIGA